MSLSHVLITRPEADAQALVDWASAQGLTPVIMPAYSFGVFGDPVTDDPDWRSQSCRLAVFSSPRAVSFGLERVQPGLLDDAHIAAVGPASAAALEAAGLHVDLIPSDAYNSEALLREILQRLDPGAALLFSAPGGRTVLADGLKQAGWRVRHAHVYQREPREPGARETRLLQQADQIASVWTSGTAMNWLAEKLPATAWRKLLAGPWVVVSPRLAGQARELGAVRVQLSEGPDSGSLRDALASLLATEGAGRMSLD